MKTQMKSYLHRVFSIAVITTVVTFIAVGGFLIHAASQKREFNGKLSFKICKKLPNGQWQEIDKGEAPLSFEASLFEVASGKQFTSNHVWSGTSAKGKSFNSTLQGTGKVNADLASGKFELPSVPIKLASEGKSVLAEFAFTTESVRTPNGETLNGKRARITNKQGDITVVGFSKPVLVQREEQLVGTQKLVDKKKVVEEIIFIVRAEGRIAAK